MNVQRLLLLIVCGLMAIAGSGCTTTKLVRTSVEVELDSIEPGQKIYITTNKGSYETFYIPMIVTDVNAERIQGDLFDFASGTDFEVNVEDIEHIYIMEKNRVTHLTQETRVAFGKIFLSIILIALMPWLLL